MTTILTRGGDDELYTMFNQQTVKFGNNNFREKMTERNYKYRNLIDDDAKRILK